MQGDVSGDELTEHLFEGFQLIGADWRFLCVNDTGARHLRRERFELLGRSLLDVFPGIEKTSLFTALSRCMATREATDLSQQLTFAHGESAFFEMRLRPTDKGLMIFSLDVTERRDTGQQLARFFALSPDLMAVAGFDGYFQHLSPSWEKVLGYPLAELQAHPWLHFVHPDDHPDTLTAGERLRCGEELKLFVNRYRCRDGSWRWIEWHCTPDLDRQQIFAVARDVTERREADAALRHAALFPEENPSPVLRIARDGTLLFANRASAPLLAAWRSAVGTSAPDAILAEVEAAFAHGSLQEFELPYDQRVLSFQIMPFADRAYANLYGRDITERVHVKAALRESDRRLRRAEAVAHLGHWRMPLDSDTMQWSDELFRIFGVDRHAFTPTRESYLALLHPDDREDVDRTFAELRQSGAETFQYRIVRPDGTLRHIAGHGEIERDGSGRESAFFGTLQDVTEILQQEKELQLKNAEVERFAYTVSHDLRSPLVTVRTFLSCLEQDLARNHADRVEKDIYFMRTATDKMWRLLDELMEMTRIGRVVSHPEELSFQEVAETARALVSGRILERQVRVNLTAEPLTLFGDRSRLVEIWQNLLENAVKFMGAQAAPLIEIGTDVEGREPVFYVRDNGIGIDPRYHGKIFGLFEKIETGSEGTGLGLALVKRIVEMYDGRIWVESAGSGQGTTFRFTLPRAIVNRSKGGAA